MSANYTEDLVATEPDGNFLYYFAIECSANKDVMEVFIDKMIANLSNLLTNTEIHILKVIRTSVQTGMHLITKSQQDELSQIDCDINNRIISFDEGIRRNLEIVGSTQIYQQVNAFFSALFSRDINNYNTFMSRARKILTDDMFRGRGFVNLDFFPAMMP